MDVQAAPPTYTPVGGFQPPAGNPPVLGPQVPGRAGGLPAQGGLSVLQNPLAQPLQSQMPPTPQGDSAVTQQAAQHAQQFGRGEDTMLVHMTPNEVNSLQGLAMASGGSLTINPHTGLPEAGWLGKLLPMIAGIGLNFLLPGSGLAIKGLSTALQSGLMTGIAGTALTGSLKEGLMAGLGAYGGASLAGGVQGALGGAAKAAATSAPTAATAAIPGATNAANLGMNSITNGVLSGGTAGLGGASAVGSNMVGGIANLGATTLPSAVAPMTQVLAPEVARSVAQYAAPVATQAAKTGLPGFFQGFTDTAKGSMTGLAGKAAVPLAAMGVMNTMSNVMTPSGGKGPDGAVDNSYQGPYYSQERPATFAPSTQDILSSSKERDYFAVDQPETYNMQGQLVQPGSETAPGSMILRPMLNPKAKKNENMYTFQPMPWKGNMGYAEGGKVHMDEGSFVMPARETAEFGKGSTEAGQRMLAGLGGLPIRGRGNGISDDIPARIGKSEARVADGEVHFPPEAVRRIGKGSHARGTKKLYAMMAKAEKSRKHAARGGSGLDLAKGLGAIA